MGHENKCAHLHGHNYVVFITAEQLISSATEGTSESNSIGRTDTIGRVVDFSVLKKVYNTWIEARWDHGFLLHHADTAGREALGVFEEKSKVNQKRYLMACNPTAENMAGFLLLHDEFVQALASYHVRAVKVTVHETENCQATATL